MFYNSFCVPLAGSVIFSPVVFISKPSHNNTKSTLEASLKESRAHGRNLAVSQRKHGKILWQACRWMWAKPPKLLLLAQSRGRLGNTCRKAHWLAFCVEIQQCQALWDRFWRTKCLKVPGRQSYFTLLDIESVWANHIWPYWLHNCWQPITLHLIGYWTTGTPMISQLI